MAIARGQGGLSPKDQLGTYLPLEPTAPKGDQVTALLTLTTRFRSRICTVLLKLYRRKALQINVPINNPIK